MNNNNHYATNSTIRCSVENCAYHNQNYCSLNQIQVGAAGGNVTNCKETQCASFQLSSTTGIQ